MKRIIHLLSSLLLTAALTACAGTAQNSKPQENKTEEKEITMEAIVTANNSDSLFKKYSSVLADLTGDYLNYSLYTSKDLCCELQEGYNFMTDGTDNWFYHNLNGDMELLYRWFAMSDADKQKRMITLDRYKDPVTDSEYSLKEEIENIEDRGDGTLAVTTVLKSEEFEKVLRLYGDEFPEEFYKADSESIYILDKETLEILSADTNLRIGDKTIHFAKTVVTHNAEQPEVVKTMTALTEEFRNSSKDSENTVTVIYDYGTEAEETYEVHIDPRFTLIPVFKDGYENIYYDSEKTKPYEYDLINEGVLYAFPQE